MVDLDRRAALQVGGTVVAGFVAYKLFDDHRDKEKLKAAFDVFAVILSAITLKRLEIAVKETSVMLAFFTAFFRPTEANTATIPAMQIEDNTRISKVMTELLGCVVNGRFKEALQVCESPAMNVLASQDQRIRDLLEQTKLTIKCYFAPMKFAEAAALPKDRPEYLLISMSHILKQRNRSNVYLAMFKERYAIFTQMNNIALYQQLFLLSLTFSASILFLYDFSNNTHYVNYRTALIANKDLLSKVEGYVESQNFAKSPIDIRRMFNALRLKYKVLSTQIEEYNDFTEKRDVEYNQILLNIDDEVFFSIDEKYHLKAIKAYANNIFGDAYEYAKKTRFIEGRYIEIFAKYYSNYNGDFTLEERRELFKMLSYAKKQNKQLFTQIRNESKSADTIMDNIEKFGNEGQTPLAPLVNSLRYF